VENKLEGIAFSIEYYLLNEAKNGEIDFDFIAKDYAAKYNQNSTFQGESLRIPLSVMTEKCWVIRMQILIKWKIT